MCVCGGEGGQCINPRIQRPCVCVCGGGGGGVNALILGYSGRVCVCGEVNASILGYSGRVCVCEGRSMH